ncbi:hypothetical protein AWB75_07029 [Caballeronia catudaia]|uniref:Uncharacterized protein n=1 Tax=Caballeronia catudaia TaxID=1777136 RepID=A0A158DPS8_9BURK|nr:hypothetical protein [Caballeronia catudaia]SAK96604.1 hypothetical protein AWB75_07029 [Caballeronia catudaia]
MAFLAFLGTLAFVAVVSLSLMAVWDIFLPRPAKLARAKRSAEYVRARSSRGS